MWNTGCHLITNLTNHDIYVIDQEDHRWHLHLGAKGTAGSSAFYGPDVIFPWCVSDLEVRNKAFLFMNGQGLGSPGMFYMFQNYHDNRVYYADFSGGSPSFDNRQFAGAPESSYLNIEVSEAGLPSASPFSYPPPNVTITFGGGSGDPNGGDNGGGEGDGGGEDGGGDDGDEGMNI